MNTILIYILAIAAAELIGAWVNPMGGFWMHMVLIVLLLGHYLAWGQSPYRRILPVLMLAPLLRLLSLALPAPVRLIPQIYWYALVGAPLLVAAFLVVRLLDLPQTSLGLPVPYPVWQGLIAFSGLPLGVAAFSILQPKPIINGSDWWAVFVGSLILAIFTGFTEEFIFRGLLQQVTGEAFGGRAAVLCSSFLFAAMYTGSLSWPYLLFIGLVGLYFGYCVYKTGSIWGVTLAHTFMNILLIVIWPTVARGLR